MNIIKNYAAGGTIAAYRIVKFDSSDGVVIQAAAATDLQMGVLAQPGGASSGDRCDVVHHGLAEVEFGGTVARGAAIAADSNGKAVAADPAATVNNRIIGFALKTQAAGDIALAYIAPGLMQGAGTGA